MATLGGLTTDTGPWYQALHKPSFQPPDWLFAPAWTLIYALITASAVTAWWHVPPARGRRWVIALFCLNLALNLLWSILFFALRHPNWALFEVGALWASIAALIIAIWPFSRRAALFLVPYFVWVSFASVINYAVVQLNP